MTMRESMRVIKRFHIDCSHDMLSKIQVQLQIYLLIYLLSISWVSCDRVIVCAVVLLGVVVKMRLVATTTNYAHA